MIDASVPMQEQSVFYLRQWPLAEHDRALLQQSCTDDRQILLIVTEQALETLWQNPDELLDFPHTCYAVHTEIELLRADNSTLADLPFPAFIMQLNDASWVELTLQSQLVTYFA
ncbi:hypothetical protein J6J34_06585 [Pseudidiomarina sp. 1ASP75-14]|uniref:hypothetical protein n=1 Tax=Pseudidiomarina terrestris TaxID=2820060 RepID=UPI002653524A|nr:hypothetical protein [Pseudidiomarina sp. 1ASP75-14]MDN7137870.1 hypothetical protein [Pseudidiomarina sp. 1ASP75-14]